MGRQRFVTAAEIGDDTGEAARCANTPRPLTEPPYLEGGSAVSIMLPPDTEGNNRAPGWRADDLAPETVAPFRARFETKFVRGAPDDCWEWRGYRFANGYGALPNSRRSEDGSRRGHLLAHRIAWVAATGSPLTDNLTIDHLCRNRACVNPAHLEPVTMAENASRARLALNGGRRQTREEALAHAAAYDRARYRADPEKARARRAERKPCPICGGMYRSNGLARHRRTHGSAA